MILLYLLGYFVTGIILLALLRLVWGPIKTLCDGDIAFIVIIWPLAFVISVMMGIGTIITMIINAENGPIRKYLDWIRGK